MLHFYFTLLRSFRIVSFRIVSFICCFLKLLELLLFLMGSGWVFSEAAGFFWYVLYLTAVNLIVLIVNDDLGA